jgi:hypothetical protein
MISRDDPLIRDALEDYTPERPGVRPDWENVLRRMKAEVGSGSGSKRTRRIFVVALAAAALLIGSTIAVGAGEGWWFARSIGGMPAPQQVVPAGDVLVAASGNWDNQDWTLIAYRDEVGKQCSSFMVGVSAANAASGVGPVSCGDVGRDVSVGFGPKSSGFPAYLEGSVTASASKVRVTLSDGSTIDANTYPPPEGLGLPLRYVALPLPCGVLPTNIAGIDDQGNVVDQTDIPAPRGPSGGSASVNACS